MNQESNELVERVFGESSFASCSLVDQRNVVKNGKDIDLVLASPLG
jgi:aryl-alcohol dehydrogenase